ncbi:MAG: response regulator [Sandaracinaceae bacterium]|nr:response regulator [Sandaracinaceae bacterium]
MTEPRHRVLVVDDHEDNLDLLRRRLERKGYDVGTVTSGPDALGVLEREDIDIVILDVMMPGMSGLEVLETVRRTRSSEELPIIMATAKAESADVIEALDKGANDYVVKPIDLDVLLARMRACLRNVKRPATQPETQLVMGHVLDRKYELGPKIGTGGFGTVYRATHVSLKNPVAVKILHEHLLGSEKAVRRFAQEGVSACRVRHPNAVAILDAGTTWDGLPYLVMELLDGPTLAQELDSVGVMRLARAAAIASPLCGALEAAHKEGIVHRDVKPANVMLSRDGSGGELVKVLDFGIAKLVESHPGAPATVDEVAGTPQYMAPERLLGEGCDWRADVYSVGGDALRDAQRLHALRLQERQRARAGAPASAHDTASDHRAAPRAARRSRRPDHGHPGARPPRAASPRRDRRRARGARLGLDRARVASAAARADAGARRDGDEHPAPPPQRRDDPRRAPRPPHALRHRPEASGRRRRRNGRRHRRSQRPLRRAARRSGGVRPRRRAARRSARTGGSGLAPFGGTAHAEVHHVPSRRRAAPLRRVRRGDRVREGVPLPRDRAAEPRGHLLRQGHAQPRCAPHRRDGGATRGAAALRGSKNR